MITPVRHNPLTPIKRPSQGRAVALREVAPVYPAAALQARMMPPAHFGAQLLALGLHYGLDDLVNRVDDAMPVTPHTQQAYRSYEEARDFFSYEDRPSFVARWVA